MPEDINKSITNSRHPLSAKEYLDGIVNGKRSILSKAITLIESSNLQDQNIAEELIELCLPLSGKSVRIGIGGAFAPAYIS